jgi:polysaccharide biosynthesis protein VpsQ
MTNGSTNQWGCRWVSQKGAIAFYLYLLLLLLLVISAQVRLVSIPMRILPAHVMLAHFILLGIASYLGYWGLQRRTVWLWQWQLPLGPLLVAALASVYEAIQIAWFDYATGIADLAAGLSGIVLFYRLARTRS